jgi:hypothetical protein
MNTFTAYKNSYTGKAFQSPTACLLDEFQFLREQLKHAVNALLLLPHLDMEHQCDYIREHLDRVVQKAKEYQELYNKQLVTSYPDFDNQVILLKKAA